MYDVLPETLARAQRGICPTCGAPMRLAEAGREARCDFCGGNSQLRFTLRALEPEAAKLEKAVIKGATRWLSKQATYQDCTCPGCGATFQADAGHSIQTCKYCGAQSKLETRLVPITTDDVPEPTERTRIDYENKFRDRLDYPWDVQTEQLVWRILHEPELLPRINLAQSFESWSYINHTAAHFLPWLLRQIQRDHDAVAFPAADAIGKLLCEGDPTLWPGVIQACRGSVFDVNAKACVLHELGLGKGVCVKTLIDTAEFAAAHGARDYACQALWAVNTLIGRNFDEHPVIAQIVLYRLFYVTGPVLGWALYTMRSSYLRGRFPLEFLVQAIDELSIERPQVVEHLLDCLYAGEADAAEFEKRLGFIRNAQGWGGRAAGFELLYKPVDDEKLMAEAVALIDADLDDPQAGVAAEGALYRLICGADATGEAIHKLVEKRGEGLSYRVKREYIRRNPDTKLLATSQKYYWQSEPKRGFDPEMQKLVDDWNEGIRAAVDHYHQAREACKELREQARALEVPIFLREGPATLPLSAKAQEEQRRRQEQEEQRQQRQAEAQARQERREADVGSQQAEMQRLQAEYQQQMEALSQKLMNNMNNQKLVMQVSAEMQKLATDLQQKMQKLFGNE